MSGAPGRVTVLDLEPVNADFLAEVLAGLSGSPRTLPCKFFYDERGADLFQKICELPEYYITRTETKLLRRYAPEIAESIGPNAAVIGFGTGAGHQDAVVARTSPESHRVHSGRYLQAAPDRFRS